MDGLHVAFQGFVGGLPELKYTSSGTPALWFSVVVSDRKAAEKNQEPLWIKCTSWGETAEGLKDSLRKGSEIYIEGKLTISRWQAPDGTERTSLNCSAWTVQPLGQIGRKMSKSSAEEPQERPAVASSRKPLVWGATAV